MKYFKERIAKTIEDQRKQPEVKLSKKEAEKFKQTLLYMLQGTKAYTDLLDMESEEEAKKMIVGKMLNQDEQQEGYLNEEDEFVAMLNECVYDLAKGIVEDSGGMTKVTAELADDIRNPSKTFNILQEKVIAVMGVPALTTNLSAISFRILLDEIEVKAGRPVSPQLLMRIFTRNAAFKTGEAVDLERAVYTWTDLSISLIAYCVSRGGISLEEAKGTVLPKPKS